MNLYLDGTVNPQYSTSIRNTYREMDNWRSSRTLVIRKATDEELAVFDRIPRRMYLDNARFHDFRW